MIKWSVTNLSFSTVSGKVIHSLDGSNIIDATVKIRKGWNNRIGKTVTITLDADFLETGTFKYSVHDFTNKSYTSSTALSLSDAVVRVYQGNCLILNLNVPKNKEGTVWHVFDLTKDGIQLSNEFCNALSASSVK